MPIICQLGCMLVPCNPGKAGSLADSWEPHLNALTRLFTSELSV